MIDIANTSPSYWEKVLEAEGLGVVTPAKTRCRKCRKILIDAPGFSAVSDDCPFCGKQAEEIER